MTNRVEKNKFLHIRRNVSLNVTASGSDTVLFTPFPGKRLVVTKVITITKVKTGTVTTPPQWKLTDGTTDIVAAAAHQSATEGLETAPTVVIGPVVDSDHPLTYVETVKQVGGTKYTADIIIEGYFL